MLKRGTKAILLISACAATAHAGMVFARTGDHQSPVNAGRHGDSSTALSLATLNWLCPGSTALPPGAAQPTSQEPIATLAVGPVLRELPPGPSSGALASAALGSLGAFWAGRSWRRLHLVWGPAYPGGPEPSDDATPALLECAALPVPFNPPLTAAEPGAYLPPDAPAIRRAPWALASTAPRGPPAGARSAT